MRKLKKKNYNLYQYTLYARAVPVWLFSSTLNGQCSITANGKFSYIVISDCFDLYLYFCALFYKLWVNKLNSSK